MNNEQKKRYWKIFIEEFYLLDIKQNEFYISGSTANVYKIKISNNFFSCNCPDGMRCTPKVMNASHSFPDGKTWVHNKKCVCKHVCFILYKVIKLIDKNNAENHPFFSRLVLTNDELNIIHNKIEKINLMCNENVNLNYLEKYKNLDSVIDMSIFNSSNGEQKIFNEDDICAICFDMLSDVNTSPNKKIQTAHLAICPMCHNYIHKKCIQKWLNSGKNTCVYCRSDIWRKYGSETNYKNLT